MPIKKYINFQDASEELWVLNPAANYYERLKNAFKFWNQLQTRRIKRGIQKFKDYREYTTYKGYGNINS